MLARHMHMTVCNGCLSLPTNHTAYCMYAMRQKVCFGQSELPIAAPPAWSIANAFRPPVTDDTLAWQLLPCYFPFLQNLKPHDLAARMHDCRLSTSMLACGKPCVQTC